MQVSLLDFDVHAHAVLDAVYDALILATYHTVWRDHLICIASARVYPESLTDYQIIYRVKHYVFRLSMYRVRINQCTKWCP
jgi:hypothetical protein